MKSYWIKLNDRFHVKIDADRVWVSKTGTLYFKSQGKLLAAFKEGEWLGFREHGPDPDSYLTSY